METVSRNSQTCREEVISSVLQNVSIGQDLNAASDKEEKRAAISTSESNLICFIGPDNMRRTTNGSGNEPLMLGDHASASHRNCMPALSSDDRVHAEGDFMAAFGHTKGLGSMQMHFFCLRTVNSTGGALSSRHQWPTAAIVMNFSGRRVLLWRKSKTDSSKWDGHADMLLSEVLFILELYISRNRFLHMLAQLTMTASTAAFCYMPR